MMLLAALLLLSWAGFEEVRFMTGYWRGESGQTVIEEVWLPVEGDAMHSVFRMVQGGKTVFTEYQSIERKEEGLVLHLRHFGRGLTAREDREGALRWRIERAEPNFVVFRQEDKETRLEYRREGEAMTVTLVKEGKRQPFRYRLFKGL